MSSPLKKNAFAVLLTSGVNMACQLLTVRLLVRELGQDRYGLYVLVATVGGYILLLTPNIMMSASKRLTERLHVEDMEGAVRYQRSQVAMTLIAAVAGLAAFALLATIYHIPGAKVGRLEVATLFAACALTLPAELINQLLEAVLFATDSFQRSALASALNKIVGSICALSLVAVFKRPEMVFIGVAIGSSVGIAVDLHGLAKRRMPLFFNPRLFREEARDLIRLALLGYPHRLMTGVANSSDRLLLPYSGQPLSQLGLYAIAYRIPEAIQNLLSPITSVLVPKITRAAATSPEEMAPMMDRYGLLFLAAGVGVIVPVTAFGRPLFQMWLGEVPGAAPLAMALLGAYFLGQLYISIMMKPFYAIGNLHHSAAFQTYNAGLTVLLTIPCAKAAGIVGVAAMNAAISLSQIVPFLFLLRKRCVPEFPIARHLSRVALALAVAVLTAVPCYTVSATPLLARAPWLALVLIPSAAALATALMVALHIAPNPLRNKAFMSRLTGGR